MKKNKLPFIRWYASDFLAGTRGMKASEVGVYTILLNLMYEQCKPLPQDIDYLSSQCGCRKPAFLKVLEKLKSRDKIIIKDSGLWNERVEKEFTFRAKKSATATHNINQRWRKDNEINGTSIQTNGSGNTDVILSQKPYSRNHISEEKTRKKDFLEMDNNFLLWSAEYPKEGNKKRAKEEFILALDRIEFDKLMEATKDYAGSVDLKRPRYIKSPHNWLKDDCWKDPLPEKEFDPVEYLKQKREKENEDNGIHRPDSG